MASEAARPSVPEPIVRDPAIMSGRPVFRGTRVPVDVLFDNLADGLTVNEVLESYPSLNRADVLAVLSRCHPGSRDQVAG